MTASRSTCDVPATRTGSALRLWSAMRSASRAYLKWYERRAARYHLSGLDDHMLKDIGISRSEIEAAVCDGRSRRNW